MKTNIKILAISISISLIFSQNSCTKEEIIEQTNANFVAENKTMGFSNISKNPGSPARNKLDLGLKTGHFQQEEPIVLVANAYNTDLKARVAWADKGCRKFEKITTSYTDLYDELAVVYYKTNNLIDYIDISYSDDPTYNGRYVFEYLDNLKTIKIKYKYNSGLAFDYTDVITLDNNGYAKSYLHDLTNYYYDEPYEDFITYNSAGYPTNFNTWYKSKFIEMNVVKYTPENNPDTITETISGEVSTFTNDLTKPTKVTLSATPFWNDYWGLYGRDNTNYWTKKVVKDKSNKIIFTADLKREYLSNGYLSKVTRIEDGKEILIFKDITYDCKNYNVSQPRSYK